MNPRLGAYLLVTIVYLGGIACLRRPATTPSRTLEPQLIEPQSSSPPGQVTKDANAISLRLLDTQARGNFGRRLLHQQPNGELTQDAVWLWSSAPARYLDTALHLELATRSNMRLVESAGAPELAATLLEWNIDSAAGTRLVGAVEFQITDNNHVVHTEVVRASEPVSSELPGNLASAAGRLLRRLASEGLTRVANVAAGPTSPQVAPSR
jgi:hypothetical protein